MKYAVQKPNFYIYFDNEMFVPVYRRMINEKAKQLFRLGAWCLNVKII